MGDCSVSNQTGTVSHSSKRRRNPAASRERVLDAGALEFGEQGFEAARISEIARRSGLSTGAIFSRWRSKQELFLAVVEQRGARGTEAASARADLSTLEKLALLGGGLLSSVTDEVRNLMLEACVVARRDPSLSSDIAQAFDGEAAVLADVIAHGKTTGEVDDALSTEAIVLACQSLGLGVRLAAAVEPRSAGRPTPEQWNELLARFIGSIRPSPESSSNTDD